MRVIKVYDGQYYNIGEPMKVAHLSKSLEEGIPWEADGKLVWPSDKVKELSDEELIENRDRLRVVDFFMCDVDGVRNGFDISTMYSIYLEPKTIEIF